jgi:ssDNA-binding Zn-finger/Zn-ribbon topoisomerase 1
MSAAEHIPHESELPDCPVCSGRLDLVYDRFNQKVYVCIDCHVGLTVPESAWDVLRKKREQNWPAKD